MKTVLIPVIALTLALKLCGGGPSKPKTDPSVPQPVDIVVHVYEGDPANDSKVEGAQVRIDGCEDPKCSAVADGAGNALLKALAGVYSVCATADGYEGGCETMAAPGSVKLVLKRVQPVLTQIRVDGRFFVNDKGTFRPVWASTLAVLSKPDSEQDAVLDQVKALGFNGVRVFAGDLGWANQTPQMARERLPRLLKAAAARGLYVYVCALTGGGYDVAAHLEQVAQMVRDNRNAVLEVANEIGHPSQSDIGKDPARLLELAKRVVPGDVTWTLGAPVETDEPTPEGTYPTDGGQFNDAHLDRGRDPWNMVRRLREIYAISEVTRKPAMSGEPVGSAEATIPGRRLHDPSIFRAMGLLCRGFELGCVFHSEDGLFGRLLGPNQTEDAKAFLQGAKDIPADSRLQFLNAGWSHSPVESADFDNGIVRAYSFVAGNIGWTVLLGLKGDPKLVTKNGWKVVGKVTEFPGVMVLEISK
jgi:hypothetical protein